MDNNTVAEIAQRLEDAQDMLARGNDNAENGGDSTGYLFGILAELIEVAKAQQATIERLTQK